MGQKQLNASLPLMKWIIHFIVFLGGLRLVAKEKWKLCLTTEYLLLQTGKMREKTLTGENASTTYLRSAIIKINMLDWYFLLLALTHWYGMGELAFVSAFSISFVLLLCCCLFRCVTINKRRYAICSITFMLVKIITLQTM